MILRRVEAAWSSGLVGQLLRFGIAGGISTSVYSAVYLPLSLLVLPREWAVLAVPPAFLAAVVLGYFLHSAFSFRGHGSRDRAPLRQAKFVVVQAFGLLLHAAMTWVLTAVLHQPAWVPLIPGILLVPLLTFFLNRQWVFA